jgi:Glycosyltransferase family 87
MDTLPLTDSEHSLGALKPPMKSRRILTAISFLAVGPVLLFLLMWLPLRLYGLGTSADFITFYCAGRIISGGHAVKLYDYDLQLTIQQSFTNHSVPLLFNHLPFEALAFVPLSYFSYPIAYLSWVFFSLWLLGLIMWLFVSWGVELTLVERLTVLAASLYPMFATVMQGQDSFVILLAYALTFLNLKRRCDFRAGCWLALGLLKPQLVLPFVLLFLLKKRWSFVSGFTCAAGILLALSAAIVGIRTLTQYAFLLLNMNGDRSRESFHIYPGMMPNIRGLFHLLLAGTISAIALNISILVVSVALMIWAAQNLKTLPEAENDGFDLEFSLAVVVTLLVSYHLLIHDLSILALPAFLVLNRLHTQDSVWSARRMFTMITLLLFFLIQSAMISLGLRQHSVSCVLLLFFAAAINIDMRTLPAATSR